MKKPFAKDYPDWVMHQAQNNHAAPDNGIAPDREEWGFHVQELALSVLCARRVMPSISCFRDSHGRGK